MWSSRAETAEFSAVAVHGVTGRLFLGRVHRYTARGDPRHQGGEGVAGTPGVRLPGVLPLQLGACLCDGIARDIVPPSDRLRVDFFALLTVFMADPSGRPQSSGVARRRRERRLRSMLRHERMTVAMALAEFSHHSSRGQRMARAGVWGHEQNYTAKIRKPPTPHPELFSLEEEPGGGLPAPLSEVAGRQEKFGAARLGRSRLRLPGRADS